MRHSNILEERILADAPRKPAGFIQSAIQHSHQLVSIARSEHNTGVPIRSRRSFKVLAEIDDDFLIGYGDLKVIGITPVFRGRRRGDVWLI